jgi:hypothetical protein
MPEQFIPVLILMIQFNSGQTTVSSMCNIVNFQCAYYQSYLVKTPSAEKDGAFTKEELEKMRACNHDSPLWTGRAMENVIQASADWSPEGWKEGDTVNLLRNLSGWMGKSLTLDPKYMGHGITDVLRNYGDADKVQIADLTIYWKDDTSKPPHMLSAMQWGTKFWDAFIYFGLPVAERPNPRKGTKTKHSRSAIVRDNCVHIAWMAMFLMTRGAYPTSSGKKIGQDVPHIIAKTMGMNCTPRELMMHLASFDLRKVDPAWVRFVDWSVLPKTLRNRLKMGIAGYRMPGAIKCLAAPSSKSDDAQKNYRWIVDLLDRDPLWAVFPPTRDDSGVNYFKDFNYECAAFIWAWYTPAQINVMVREHVLFAVPPKKPQFSG